MMQNRNREVFLIFFSFDRFVHSVLVVAQSLPNAFNQLLTKRKKLNIFVEQKAPFFFAFPSLETSHQ